MTTIDNRLDEIWDVYRESIIWDLKNGARFNEAAATAEKKAKAALSQLIAKECQEAVDTKLTELSRMKIVDMQRELVRPYNRDAKRKSRANRLQSTVKEEEDV